MQTRAVRRPLAATTVTLATFATFAFSAACIVACSGTPVDKANTGLDTSTPSSVPTTTPTSTPDPQEDAAVPEVDATTTPPTSTTTYDAGTPTVVDAGDLYEGGIPCVENGAVETEPNDTPLLANELAPTVCGAVLPGFESDFLKFTLKPATQSMYLDYAGQVTLTVTVNGKTVTLAPGTAPPVPFVRGYEYSIEIRSLDQNRQNYRVTLFER